MIGSNPGSPIGTKNPPVTVRPSQRLRMVASSDETRPLKQLVKGDHFDVVKTPAEQLEAAHHLSVYSAVLGKAAEVPSDDDLSGSNGRNLELKITRGGMLAIQHFYLADRFECGLLDLANRPNQFSRWPEHVGRPV